MIQLKAIKTGIQIIPEPTPPRAYLDYCVLRRFSDSHPQEGQQFLHSLKKLGGTLYLSWIHIIEAYNQGPSLSYKKLLRYFHQVGHYWGILDCEHSRVIEKEKNWLPGMQGPHIDELMIRETFFNWIRRRNYLIKLLLPLLVELKVIRFTPKILFDELLQCPDDYEKYKELAVTTKTDFKRIFDDARNAVRKFPKVKKNFQRKQPNHQEGKPPTQYLEGVLYKQIILGNDNFEENDGPDLLHAVTASAYSDFVVLDNKWAKRLNSVKLPVGTAKIYSITEIGTFLSDFATQSSHPIRHLHLPAD